jgi:hypothetical protein
MLLGLALLGTTASSSMSRSLSIVPELAFEFGFAIVVAGAADALALVFRGGVGNLPLAPTTAPGRRGGTAPLFKL